MGLIREPDVVELIIGCICCDKLLTEVIKYRISTQSDKIPHPVLCHFCQQLIATDTRCIKRASVLKIAAIKNAFSLSIFSSHKTRHLTYQPLLITQWSLTSLKHPAYITPDA